MKIRNMGCEKIWKYNIKIFLVKSMSESEM